MKAQTKLIIGFILLTLVLTIGHAAAYKSSATEIEIYVKEKDRITQGSGEDISSKFLIYSETEVFENTDSFLFLKFNSSDFQNRLEEDSTYTVIVAGWRVPFLSQYRNIVEIK